MTPKPVTPRLSPHIKREFHPKTSLFQADASPEDRPNSASLEFPFTSRPKASLNSCGFRPYHRYYPLRRCERLLLDNFKDVDSDDCSTRLPAVKALTVRMFFAGRVRKQPKVPSGHSRRLSCRRPVTYPLLPLAAHYATDRIGPIM